MTIHVRDKTLDDYNDAKLVMAETYDAWRTSNKRDPALRAAYKAATARYDEAFHYFCHPPGTPLEMAYVRAN